YFEKATASSLLISYVKFYAQLDMRKNEDGKFDRVRPAKGWLLSTDVQVAGFIFGGVADDVRFAPELRWYASLAKGVVLAGRVSMGLLYSHDYGFTLEQTIRPEEVI